MSEISLSDVVEVVGCAVITWTSLSAPDCLQHLVEFSPEVSSVSYVPDSMAHRFNASHAVASERFGDAMLYASSGS